MERHLSDDLRAELFVWPEPLVVDVIVDHYEDTVDPADRLGIAKFQQRMLHALYDGDLEPAMEMRRELVAFCVAAGIAPDRIDKANRAVFRELVALAGLLYRTSPRRRAALSSKFHVALGRLTITAEPVRKPVFAAPRSRPALLARAA